MKGGVINLRKEAGMTSHDAVFRIRKIFGTKKVGHAGTLDPNATGVLPILIGEATKACDLLGEETKIYRGTVRFGLETDTQDIWGNVLGRSDRMPTRDDLLRAAQTFLGEGEQIPPMVSAIKQNGKKLYEYAREGITVERAARPITVFSLDLLSFTGEEAVFRTEVSKGTYIRTLFYDLCVKMGVLGTMSCLEREKSGIFLLEEAKTLSQLEAMSPEEREASLVPTESLFTCYEPFVLPNFYDRLIRNGCAVLIQKLKWKQSSQVGTRVRLYQGDRFVALGQLIEDEEGIKLRKIKDFSAE